MVEYHNVDVTAVDAHEVEAAPRRKEGRRKRNSLQCTAYLDDIFLTVVCRGACDDVALQKSARRHPRPAVLAFNDEQRWLP
jgi:hypothetical protein